MLQRDGAYLWPPRCTLSFYRDSGRRFWWTHERDYDLFEALFLDWPHQSRRVTFGISTRSRRSEWDHWNESNVCKLERLISWDFENDDCHVRAERIDPLTGRCTTEFRWRLHIRV